VESAEAEETGVGYPKPLKGLSAAVSVLYSIFVVGNKITKINTGKFFGRFNQRIFRALVQHRYNFIEFIWF
jgi:hypothetical protein